METDADEGIPNKNTSYTFFAEELVVDYIVVLVAYTFLDIIYLAR